MKRETISGTGISCTGCEQNVETSLQKLDGVTRVEADHERKTVEVVTEDDVSGADMRAAIWGRFTTSRLDQRPTLLQLRSHQYLRPETPC